MRKLKRAFYRAFIRYDITLRITALYFMNLQYYWFLNYFIFRVSLVFNNINSERIFGKYQQYLIALICRLKIDNNLELYVDNKNII